MPSRRLDILYLDNHLLALNKPPGLPTMGAAAGQPSLLALAKQYIKQRFRKPGNVYLGVMHRLDAGASGVVLFARTSKAAARLTEQFRDRQVDKTYWALVSGTVEPRQGELVDWLVKDEAHMRMATAAAGVAGAKEARLRYRVLREITGGTLLEIELLSGRKHQIRVQLATRGWPIWGETKYAQARAFGGTLALHARRLAIEHPVGKGPLVIEAPLPPSWRTLGIEGMST